MKKPECFGKSEETDICQNTCFLIELCRETSSLNEALKKFAELFDFYTSICEKTTEKV